MSASKAARTAAQVFSPARPWRAVRVDRVYRLFQFPAPNLSCRCLYFSGAMVFCVEEGEESALGFARDGVTTNGS
ncbi:hypothetical protein FHR83_009284 [Actinoplanes campanulatus]|uniref:Uncharacterized protein n=1 Tax=Actinoplanes campanulatus TaxID=113559 RepID=A0A7W5ASL8_9ACTN|nr:hypothetical protein [Actinoplanes campanulatus]MBB3101555.1 hypothetical protein [Actinoplanes campanulatus]